MSQLARRTSRLQREFISCPITALEFFTSSTGDAHLLVGEHADLAAYGLPSAQLLGRFRIFKTEPIHGIHSSKAGSDGECAVILVWGGRSVAALSAKGLENALLGGNPGGSRLEVLEVEAHDWIYAGRMYPFDGPRGVLITGHNEAVEVSVSASGTMTLGQASSPSRSMLYSADVAWLSKNAVLVAGGTVFGEIIIWKCDYFPTRAAVATNLFTLTGHEGSIFGVDISPDLALHGEPFRLLSSCSDDRTIRIWDITERGPSSQSLPSSKITGFVPFSEVEYPNDRLVASIMGHAARIWSAKFLCEKDEIWVISCGEDATVQKWRLDVDAETRQTRGRVGTLEHVETRTLHSGKHIWSSAIARIGDQCLVATGGADGKVCVFDVVNEEGRGREKAEISSPLGDVLRQVGVRVDSAKRAKSITFRQFAFVDRNTLIAVATGGRLLLASIGAGYVEWEGIPLSEPDAGDVQQCSVMEGIPGGVLIGTVKGSLFLYTRARGVELLKQGLGSIYGVVLLSRHRVGSDAEETSKAVENEHELQALVSRRAEEPLLFTINESTIIAESSLTALDKRFITSSAALLGGILLMGSRHGFLAALRKEAEEWMILDEWQMQSVDAVSAILPLPTRPDSRVIHFGVTCRDSYFRIFSLDPSSEKPCLVVCHEMPVMFGQGFEGGWVQPQADESCDLILFGYHNGALLFWNETTRTEIARFPGSGNAHRSLLVSKPGVSPMQFSVASTRGTCLNMWQYSRPDTTIMQPGTHGREIRTVDSTTIGEDAYLATGSEDTTVAIWRYNTGEKATEMHIVASLKIHRAGLQCVRWVGPEYLVTSAGNEELFVWRVRKLESGVVPLGVVCEGVFADKSPEGVLRITDFDFHGLEAGGYLVSIAFSNSVLAMYRYSEGRFVKLASGLYTGACLTQIKFLRVDGEVDVLTASTDGCLGIWRSSLILDGEAQELMLVKTVRVHQSSVQTLSISPLRDTPGHLVITGGDDNALVASTVSRSPASSPNYAHECTVQADAHAASINGCTLTRDGDGWEIFTGSNDQRVRRWSVAVGEDGKPVVRLKESRPSGVADAGDVAAVPGGGVVVVGAGMEVWKVN